MAVAEKVKAVAKPPVSPVLRRLRKAHLKSTPLVAVKTGDPGATLSAAAAVLDAESPKIRWDVAAGFAPVAGPGAKLALEALNQMAGGEDPSEITSPVEALRALKRLPSESVVFMLNMHRFVQGEDVGSAMVAQSMWNLRDEFKADGRMLVMLVPDISLPAELSSDVLVLDEPFPSPDQLGELVKEMAANPDVKITLDEKTETRSVDALRGLPSLFAAEQALAMSVERTAIDIDELWEGKRKIITATPGLKISRTGMTFAQIGGVANAKEFLLDIINGEDAPRCIVFIDEIEKQMAGAVGGDTSGVSQDALGVTLMEMEDNGYDGVVFVGPPGAAKSALGKSIGNEAGIPTLTFDFGAAKDKFVGSSEQRIRSMYKTLKAVSDGRALFIATSNREADLPDELKRRFTLGMWYFDLPDDEERKLIWPIYLAEYGIPKQPLPNDVDWTGAEIKRCCMIARRTKRTLIEAAGKIVPVAVSGAEKLAELRRRANGKFTSASYNGVYRWPRADEPVKSGRRVRSEATEEY